MRRLARHWVKGIVIGAGGRRPVHVLHIYKTGGTALKHALSNMTVTPRYVVFPHKHSVTLDCIPRGHKIVVFLRDPVDRFVSGFYGRYREGRPRYFTPWSQAEAATFAEFPTPNAIGEALAAGGDRGERAETAMASLDRMTMPYAHWLGSRETVTSRLGDFLLVGRQERLASEFERLKKLIGLPEGLLLPASDVEANRGGDYDSRLTDVSRGALRSWFADDYAYLQLFADCGLIRACGTVPDEPLQLQKGSSVR